MLENSAVTKSMLIESNQGQDPAEEIANAKHASGHRFQALPRPPPAVKLS